MLLQEKDAQSIVDEMKASIHRDINIMDERGVIIASTNPARRGTLHLGAARIIRDGLSSLTIGRDNPEEGVQRGINLPISIGGELAGVIGITGDPSEVSVFGDIIKRMTEIMVKNVRQQEENDLQDQAKRLFLENWIFSQYPDWPDLEVRGRLLGFRINEPYRIARRRNVLVTETAGSGRSTGRASVQNQPRKMRPARCPLPAARQPEAYARERRRLTGLPMLCRRTPRSCRTASSSEKFRTISTASPGSTASRCGAGS